MAEDVKPRTREMSQGFLRQRRNVLLLSILMPLFFLSGAEIKEINLLGTIITVKNQSVVKWCLGLIFAYFCIRYWQYYGEEHYTKEIVKKLKHSMYKPELVFFSHVAHKRAEVFGSDDRQISFADERAAYVFGHRRNMTKDDEHVSFLKRRTIVYMDIPGIREGNENQDNSKAKEISEFWKGVEDKDGSKLTYETGIEYSLFRIYAFRARGIFSFIFNQSYFTDYQLPFFVASASVASVVIAAVF